MSDEFMQFDGKTFTRPSLVVPLSDRLLEYPAINEPLPEDHVAVRFVGHGPRYVQVTDKDGVYLRDGELWHVGAHEQDRTDVQLYRNPKQKPAAPPADAAVKEGN